MIMSQNQQNIIYYYLRHFKIGVIVIRKVTLNMTEQQKYNIIKQLVDTNGNKKTAALKLDCTSRHINRMINGYQLEGKSFFIHGNRNRKPTHTIPDKTKSAIVDLYKTKYYDANFTHYSELLAKHECIIVSPSTLRTVLMDEAILSPRARRSTKKKLKKQLKEKLKNAKSLKSQNQLTESIVLLEDAHPRRPRCAYFGEMLQMDASVHLWFGSEKTQLHAAIDDSAGMVVGAYFDPQETLKGYYNVLHQVLTNYGIPYMFYTDRRTVFEYKQKKSPSIEEDTYTQFSYACKQLGIDIKTTSCPQSKGRVERLFQTLQSRLPLELRLAGVTTIEQANTFLNSYIKEFNAKFSLPINHNKSVFETQPNDEKINLTLAILANRKIDNGHCIRYEKHYYRLIDSNGLPVHYYKGTPCTVIKAFNNRLFSCVGEKVYALDLIPSHEVTSKNFEFVKVTKTPTKRKIPSMTHPWKLSSFKKHVKSQKHHYDDSFDLIANSQEIKL